MDVVGHVWLLIAGLVGGVMNVVAGGGSLITVPALMVFGLPAGVANATNRLSVISQSVAGTVGFARAKALDRTALVPIVATAAVGALGGSLAAAYVPSRILEYVLLGVMISMAVVLVVVPNAVVSHGDDAQPRWHDRRWVSLLALFATGLYGGFVQAGVGYLLVVVLAGVVGYPVKRANALKSVSTLVFGAVSMVVFVAKGLIAWEPAILLAIYTYVGALLGVKIALKVNPRVMRWLLLAGVVSTSIAAILK